MAIGQTVAEIWQFIIFQYGGGPPSWICCALVWATHEEHLVLLIVVQNLVGIGALVSIMHHFTFCPFGLKMPIHAHKIGVLRDLVP